MWCTKMASHPFTSIGDAADAVSICKLKFDALKATDDTLFGSSVANASERI